MKYQICKITLLNDEVRFYPQYSPDLVPLVYSNFNIRTLRDTYSPTCTPQEGCCDDNNHLFFSSEECARSFLSTKRGKRIKQETIIPYP